eukprot:CAMPEP_0115231178 /NCGR_PEP_ID=MMETSP0270-20121206/33103_1 /TAXON_ID=71861 /ORGANISM="Scrippsiella trochoidea, Strain CCMP3099" /LENGTH=518 /DNA_ID=CAMNT_0002645805 /DNA_START=28 /DNA_END=1585 /DNA_ORIENTATION=+
MSACWSHISIVVLEMLQCCRRRDAKDGSQEDATPIVGRPAWLPHDVTGNSVEEEPLKRRESMEGKSTTENSQAKATPIVDRLAWLPHEVTGNRVGENPLKRRSGMEGKSTTENSQAKTTPVFRHPAWLPHEVTGNSVETESPTRNNMKGKDVMARGREQEKECTATHGICLSSQLRHRTHREGQTNLGETPSRLQSPTCVSDRVYIPQSAKAPANTSGVLGGDRAGGRSQRDSSSAIERILQGRTAWEVLGVAVRSPKGTCRQAYLRESLMVHPDKCKHPRAGEAFRRLADAYKHLSEGGPWRDGSAAASSQKQSTNSSSSYDQHQRGHPFYQPHGSDHERGGRGPGGGDPFAFFRDAAEQAFQSGEFSRDDFSDLFGEPAAVGGALVGAVLIGGLGSILGGALGSVAGGSVALDSVSACQCQRMRREGGRCEFCRGGVALGGSLGGAAGRTAGLALGVAAGASIGAKLGSAIAQLLLKVGTKIMEEDMPQRMALWRHGHAEMENIPTTCRASPEGSS